MAGPKKDKFTGSFEEYLLDELKDVEFASQYLNAAINDGDIRVFLLALGDITKARGMSYISKTTGLNRENIYRIVSERGNPQIKSIAALLNAVGLKLRTEPVRKPVSKPFAKNVRSFEAYAELRRNSDVSEEPIVARVGSVLFDDATNLTEDMRTKDMAQAA